MATSGELTEKQCKALLDILSHHEVYAEIQDFRFPGALATYGPPFGAPVGKASTSPSLQALVSRFFLTLPGMRDVSQDFWRKQVASMILDFEEAELSESYDKGHLGIRKTLATAVSALIEYPVRGVFAGFDEPDGSAEQRQYDRTNADALQQAFRDCMQQAVYGDVIDKVFEKTAETDKLVDHTQLVQATHEYVVVNLASFMHYALIKSPKGQQLLTLIDHANKLVPYTIVRQTLKIGNVASMISAMMKIILAKASLGTVTNWIGWTQSADEGMNLLQNIISTVLHWDIRDLKSRASKIERNKEAPSKEVMGTLRNYLELSREDHERIRELSQNESYSIVHAILVASGQATTSLSPVAHKHALDYLSIQLSIRDRHEIVRILCHSQPDHLTQCIRDGVAAYEPMIRKLHEAVDLSDTVYDFEIFLRDLIKLARLPDPSSRAGRNTPLPTVGDFVQLLKKHQGSSHKFLHQVAKNGKEVTGWYHEYAHSAASCFRQSSARASQSSAADTPRASGAGDLTQPLQDLFTSLPQSTRTTLIPILDKQALYLDKLHAASAIRLRAVLASAPSQQPTSRSSSPWRTPILSNSNNASGPPSRTNSLNARNRIGIPSRSAAATPPPQNRPTATNPGPGAFLARWQALLDGTPVTPATAEGGRVRDGNAPSVKKASAVSVDDGAGEDDDEGDAPASASAADADADGDSSDDDEFHDSRERFEDVLESALSPDERVPLPDTGPVVEALRERFRSLLGERGRNW